MCLNRFGAATPFARCSLSRLSSGKSSLMVSGGVRLLLSLCKASHSEAVQAQVCLVKCKVTIHQASLLYTGMFSVPVILSSLLY
jgi:hypothetical protein